MGRPLLELLGGFQHHYLENWRRVGADKRCSPARQLQRGEESPEPAGTLPAPTCSPRRQHRPLRRPNGFDSATVFVYGCQTCAIRERTVVAGLSVQRVWQG